MMTEARDLAIKLFGKTIQLPPNGEASTSTCITTTVPVLASASASITSSCSPRHELCNRVGDGKGDGHGEGANKKPSESELAKTRSEDSASHPAAEESNYTGTPCENHKTPSFDKEAISPQRSKNDQQSETSTSQEKTPKKPEKILPCPRCSSMDTKFCYYNNYNVNQPRHFCKHCQRYWTAGGTMRNVPVGSGRRKNKSSSASYYRNIMASNSLRANGTVLSFGSDPPTCESMGSALHLSERSQNCVHNGLNVSEQKISMSHGGKETGDFEQPAVKNTATLTPQAPGFAGPPWPCQWSTPLMPQPAVVPSAFPITFYPTPPYWGCALPRPWNVPWISPNPPPPDPTTCLSPTSPTLGKRSRDGDLLERLNSGNEEPSKVNNSERCVLVPKTIRIHDPSEAARSSIWSTLGIDKNEKNDSVNKGGMLRAFQSKGEEKTHMAKTSLVLQANPAALSRSLNFHESL
ncbi:hypothetical protein NMG60_11009227 [Bertholletia excelsa]